METNEMNVNAAVPDENATAIDPLADFYELANNLIKDRSKDPAMAIAIAYGSLNTLIRKELLTPAQAEQVLGSFTISLLNLMC